MSKDNKRKIVVIAGGWHFPVHFYEEMIKQEIPKNWEVDYFCISHRNPDLDIVRKEKEKILNEYCMDDNNILNRLDHLLYRKSINKEEIKNLGWSYIEKPNIMGDFYFVNQWAEEINYEDYDAILLSHDDNFIFQYGIFTEGVMQFNWDDWLTIANGVAASNEDFHFRGSFAIFKTELIKLMGGAFEVDNVTLNRVGKVDTPKSHSDLKDWNNIGGNFGRFVKDNNLTNKVKRFSDTYRISKFCMEGERGFLSKGGSDKMFGIFKYLENNFNMVK